jgi:peptidoglycan/xylan/chitin deacetylase (PgdA/CDA1 family)
MISVCFRFDDPSAISDHELERRIFDIFSGFDVPLCVAAIPFARTRSGESVPLSPENAAHLIDASKAGVVEIAQHGHSHIQRGHDANGAHSEFAGVAAAEQTRLIREGMEHLAGVFHQRIKGFVPPWNTYDRTTIQVLDELGFEFVSAGWEVCKSGTLPEVPRTCTLGTARRAIESALLFQSLAPVLVIVFHPDDFQEFRLPPLPDEPPPFTNLEELKALLGWISKQPGIDVDALSKIAESTRNGASLRNPADLRLPSRVKALVPPMLTRSSEWKMLPGLLWGAFRVRYGVGG